MCHRSIDSLNLGSPFQFSSELVGGLASFGRISVQDRVPGEEIGGKVFAEVEGKRKMKYKKIRFGGI